MPVYQPHIDSYREYYRGPKIPRDKKGLFTKGE
jgi:hypothetical protein